MSLFRRGGFGRGGFALTPPSMVVTIVSVAFAVVALLTHYGFIRIAMLGSGRAFTVLAIAYVVLLAGVLVRRL